MLGKCSELCGVHGHPKHDGIGAGEKKVKNAQASDENFLLGQLFAMTEKIVKRHPEWENEWGHLSEHDKC